MNDFKRERLEKTPEGQALILVFEEMGNLIRQRREQWAWNRNILARFLGKFASHVEAIENGSATMEMQIHEMLKMGFTPDEIADVIRKIKIN